MFSIAGDFINADNSSTSNVPVTLANGDAATVTFNNKYGNIGNFRLLYGAAPNLEVGAVYGIQTWEHSGMVTDNTKNIVTGSVNPSLNNNNWGLNAKYIIPNLFWDSTLGLGAVYEGFQDSQNVYQLYAVATKTLTNEKAATAVRASVGLNWTQAKFNISTIQAFTNGTITASESSDTESAFRPYVDVDVAFANKLNLTGEYQFKNDNLDTDPIASIVARYPFTENISGEIGFSNAFRGVVGQSDQHFLVGLNYMFGMAK